MTSKKLVISILLALTSNRIFAGMPHFNLYNPYDCMVTPGRALLCDSQAIAAYEYGFRGCGYQAEENEHCNSNSFRKRADILQLYQNQQDALAALKGDLFTSARGQLSQKFNINDDDGTLGLFIPYGRMNISNLMLTARYGFSDNFSFSFHLPVIAMQLKDVLWKKSPSSNLESFEDNMTTDFISALEEIGNMQLMGWRRTGVGDLAALIWGEHYFPQSRPILVGALFNGRIGFTFPTGKKEEGDFIFCPPFGNGGGLGLLGGAHLELYFTHRIKAGFDVELMYLWGHNQEMRIKTDLRQTDLLLLQKACVFKQPGFTQHFTLSLGAQNFCDRLSVECAYQFTKQQDTKVFIDSPRFDPLIVNTAESLQEWTTHSLEVGLSLDLRNYEHPHAWEPYIQVLYKHGFNGQRAVLMDTITGLFAFEF